MLNVASCL
jgi:hypothetical protein